MNEYTKPTVTRTPLVTSPVLGGANPAACKGTGVGSGAQANTACFIACSIPVIIPGAGS
jgi:hypothetical protein